MPILQVRRCECGGLMTGRTFIEIKEGEGYASMIGRIKKEMNCPRLLVHVCERCQKKKLFKQPKLDNNNF